MQAQVYRLLSQGCAQDRAAVLRTGPALGTLGLNIRLVGRGGAKWNVYLATLCGENGDYLIPCLDGAVVTEIKGRWMHVVGTEVIPRSSSTKRPNPDYFPQEWWCLLL